MAGHKQVIVIRKDLNMRKGKIAAQAAHASMKALLDLGKVSGSGDKKCISIPLTADIEPWVTGNFKKVCVSVDSEKELLDIFRLSKKKGIVCSLIQDAGLTEFGGVPTYTAVAVGPGTEESINDITGKLKLL